MNLVFIAWILVGVAAFSWSLTLGELIYDRIQKRRKQKTLSFSPTAIDFTSGTPPVGVSYALWRCR